MTEVDDDAQLSFAASQRRAVVTVNHKDFAVLHNQFIARGKEHWGIVFSTEESIPVLRRRLLSLLTSTSADELKNQIRWLNEFR